MVKKICLSKGWFWFLLVHWYYPKFLVFSLFLNRTVRFNFKNPYPDNEIFSFWLIQKKYNLYLFYCFPIIFQCTNLWRIYNNSLNKLCPLFIYKISIFYFSTSTFFISCTSSCIVHYFLVLFLLFFWWYVVVVVKGDVKFLCNMKSILILILFNIDFI